MWLYGEGASSQHRGSSLQRKPWRAASMCVVESLARVWIANRPAKAHQVDARPYASPPGTLPGLGMLAGNPDSLHMAHTQHYVSCQAARPPDGPIVRTT